MLKVFTGVLVFLIAAPGTAATITQVMTVRQAGHDTSYTPYSQFNPALGILTGVTLDFANGLARSNLWTFTCDRDAPVTSIDTIHASLVYGSQFLDLTHLYTDTFTSHPGLINHQVLIPFAGNTVISGSLSRWIGTGVNSLAPDTEISHLNGFASESLAGITAFCDTSCSVTFTETVTYTYQQQQQVVPEPMSWWLWATGLSGIMIMSDYWS